MKSHPSTGPIQIPNRLIDTICGRLAAGKRVRRNLPVWGRIHIDRQLPFLCIYRRPENYYNEGTERLIFSQPSYLIAADNRRQRESLAKLVSSVVSTLHREFGAFLVLEIWHAQNINSGKSEHSYAQNPGFRIILPRVKSIPRWVETLKNGLKKIKIRKIVSEVEVTGNARVAPGHRPQILSNSQVRDLKCYIVGIEVQPIFHNEETGEVFPMVRRKLVHDLTVVLRQTFFAFAKAETTHRPPHYHALGRRAVVKAVWEVDRQLSKVSSAFDFLLMVTPVNAESAWKEFKRKCFQTAPLFYYRPMPADPYRLKRILWDIPIRRLEDPTLAQLFLDKRDELDVRLNMLIHIDTPKFLYGSMQLFGNVGGDVVEFAKDLLKCIPARSRNTNTKNYVNAQEFAGCAKSEFSFYQEQYSGFNADIEIRADTTGLLVSRGKLLINKDVKIPEDRVVALLQHEVGTHMLTYFNGCFQPFRQLYTGLPGYDELQEGLAVLAEYLVGGMSRSRLRILAARVMAVYFLIDGATFSETFRELNAGYNIDQRNAFTVTMRVYRGGGFTKDMVYFRGLLNIIKYIKGGGSLDPLFIGKIGTEHVPIIRELQLRKVLHSAPFRPRYMSLPRTEEQLERLRKGITLCKLCERNKL